MRKSISVFGTKYKYKELKEKDKFMQTNGAVAYTDLDKKEIVMYKLDELDHELVHAHLYECGLQQLAYDENTVELLTEIFRRINKIIK